ncbi:MAG: ATP-binding protein [Candidatus Zixiibacteriota bacterium]
MENNSLINLDILKSVDLPILILNSEFQISWISDNSLKYINLHRNPGEQPFCALFAEYERYEDCPFRQILESSSARTSSKNKIAQKLNLRKGYKITAQSIPDDKNHKGWFIRIKSEKRKKELEDFVYKTHNRFKAVFEAYPHALLVIDGDKKIIYCNGKGIDMCELVPSSYFGIKIDNIDIINKIGQFHKSLEKVINEQKSSSFVDYVDDAMPLKVEIFPLEKNISDYHQEYCISIADISKEKHMQKRVKLLFKAIDSSKEGIAILDDDFVVVYSNKAFCKVIGDPDSSDSYKIKLMDVFMKDERFQAFWESMERSIITNRSFSSEIVWNNDGQSGVFDLFLSRIVLPGHNFSGFVCSIRDISVQKIYESRLAESQKLESLGNLTRSFVHDFNNILASISGSASLIKRKLDTNEVEGIYKYIEIINRSTDASLKMLMNLLHFTRSGFSEHTEVSIRDIINQAVDIVSPSMQESVKFNLLLSKKLPRILGDEVKLVEIFVNLFINANDAMPNGGEISIKTSDFIIDKDNIWEFPEACKCKYLRIDVKDTGIGIPENMQERIFEPFFSTKDSKPVAGLGLSIVKEMIRKHNGMVTVESKMQKGTIFSIFIPVFEDEDAVFED